jgi:hypothetical protein
MANKETIGDFDVTVEGRVVKAVHWTHRHEYSAQWFTDPPHLRDLQRKPNNRAERGPEAFEQEAQGAMLSKLRKDKLIRD